MRRRAPLLTRHHEVTSLVIVLRCAGRIATIIALCCAIGLHWIALQSVAWTTMLVEYSKRAPLREAIAQTFDGSHPCALCHVVTTGKKSEKKSELQSPTPKIDIICLARGIRVMPAFVPFAYGAIDYSFSVIGHSPPVPPPRCS
jgi:hypothetical protein